MNQNLRRFETRVYCIALRGDGEIQKLHKGEARLNFKPLLRRFKVPNFFSVFCEKMEDMKWREHRSLNLNTCVGRMMFPGDEFVLTPGDGNVILGPGLRLKPVLKSTTNDTNLKIAKVCKPGLLSKMKPNTFYISMGTKNYIPFKKEDVVGIITKKAGDQYVVDFGTRDRVTLSKFAFEGATKKNKPDLKIGDVVFGRFMELPKDFPFEITCVSNTGRSNGLGPLEGGMLFQIPVHLVQTLQTTNKQGGSELLKKYGSIAAFETAIGANGFVWVSSKSALTNVLISLAVQSAGNLRPEEHDTLVPLFTEAIRAASGHNS